MQTAKHPEWIYPGEDFVIIGVGVDTFCRVGVVGLESGSVSHLLFCQCGRNRRMVGGTVGVSSGLQGVNVGVGGTVYGWRYIRWCLRCRFIRFGVGVAVPVFGWWYSVGVASPFHRILGASVVRRHGR
jgi:hypothetical protein